MLLGVFLKVSSEEKGRSAAVVNLSGSSTRGQRSLLKWEIMHFLRSAETFAWALPRKRNAWVSALAAASVVRHPACCHSRMLISSPTVSSSRV